ncbi:MAG: hypothetical protein WEB55_00810 [Acidimicrobiia bacterium]
MEGDELREAGVTIRDAGARIEQLLDRISSLLRLQRDPKRQETTLSFGQLVEEHLCCAHPELGRCIQMEGDPDLVVRCEPRGLSAALHELVDNGIRHGTPPVLLSARLENDHVLLRVRDQGPGPPIDPGMSLDQTWTQISRAEVMPSEMGERLGNRLRSYPGSSRRSLPRVRTRRNRLGICLPALLG